MDEKILLEDCPICRGAGMILHEGGWSVQVECCDCSAHTIYLEYDNEEQKKSREDRRPPVEHRQGGQQRTGRVKSSENFAFLRNGAGFWPHFGEIKNF